MAHGFLPELHYEKTKALTEYILGSSMIVRVDSESHFTIFVRELYA
jgi:hypothetical protein